MADEVVKKLRALTLDDPTLKAIEKMAQVADPLAETLRAIEHSSIGRFEREMRELHERSGIGQMMETARLLNENSGITRMMESINLHKDLARTALGPLWELRDAGMLDPPWLRDIEKMRDTLGAFEARFRLPEMEETARLLKQYEESSVNGVGRRMCIVIEAIVELDTGLVGRTQIARKEIEDFLGVLIGMGVSEAHRLEETLRQIQ